jgi:D-glycero-alpha-D-manno-heptose-7-phosphate kinase
MSIDGAASLRHNQGMATRARAPLRIDLAGGWTDVPEFADAEGGAVVNVTIDKFVRGSLAGEGITYEHDVRAAGLGSSAAELVLAEALRNPDADLDDIAEAAFAAEREAGVVGGRQDQYAACYGGLSFMTFRRASAEIGPVRIERLELPEPLLRGFEKRLVLVDSGVPRLSGQIHEAVWSAYARHDNEATGALLALKQYGRAMRDALASADFGGVRHVMAENWIQQKRLHATITNQTVDALFDLAMKSGASSGKACGAGGGGALVFYASSESDALRLKRAMREAGVDVIDFAFSLEGLEDEDDVSSDG